MDVLAHTLWTNLLFLEEKGKRRFWAVAGGVLPDLVVFIPAIIIGFFTTPFNWQNPPLWVSVLYNMTHSLFIFALVSLLVLMITKKGESVWLMSGWFLNIVIDIFSHSTYYQPQFLYPMMSLSMGLLDWRNYWFVLVNYGLLATIYLGMEFQRILMQHRAKKALTAAANEFPPTIPEPGSEMEQLEPGKEAPKSERERQVKETTDQLLKEASLDSDVVPDTDISTMKVHSHTGSLLESVDQILKNAKASARSGRHLVAKPKSKKKTAKPTKKSAPKAKKPAPKLKTKAKKAKPAKKKGKK